MADTEINAEIREKLAVSPVLAVQRVREVTGARMSEAFDIVELMRDDPFNEMRFRDGKHSDPRRRKMIRGILTCLGRGKGLSFCEAKDLSSAIQSTNNLQALEGHICNGLTLQEAVRKVAG